jgi:hypothetical protein
MYTRSEHMLKKISVSQQKLQNKKYAHIPEVIQSFFPDYMIL